MTQTVTKSQRFEDPELARQAQAHRESVASNPQYVRGVAEAQENYRMNLRGRFRDELANLRRVTVDRDRCQATRDSYERTYERVRRTAEEVALEFGERQSIPAYLSRPETAEKSVTIGVPRADLGHYRESRGLGPDGEGVAPAVPGSAGDHGWLERPEEQGGGKRSTKR